MTVTLHLKPELEARPLANAQASGLALEEYLLSIVEDAAGQSKKPAGPQQSAREEAVRRMFEFGAKHQLSFGEPVTHKLLHEGHRY